MGYYFDRTKEFEALKYEETVIYFQDVLRCYLESIRTLADANSNVTNINSKKLNKLTVLSNMLLKNYEIHMQELEPDEGALLQSWISLGAVLEGCLQSFLKIYYFSYADNPVRYKNGTMKSIEKLRAYDLIEYFFGGKGIIKTEEFDKNNIDNIRTQRNLIHLFAGEIIDDWDSLNDSLKVVIEVLLDLISRLPELEYEDGYVNLCDRELYNNIYSLKNKYFVLKRH
ncbi:MAG: hypothetical protein ABS882_04045 [Lysinibacillus sp.]